MKFVLLYLITFSFSYSDIYSIVLRGNTNTRYSNQRQNGNGITNVLNYRENSGKYDS